MAPGAGIVIGACCGAGLVVAAGIFMLRWRRRQRQAEGCRADEDMKVLTANSLAALIAAWFGRENAGYQSPQTFICGCLRVVASITFAMLSSTGAPHSTLLRSPCHPCRLLEAA